MLFLKTFTDVKFTADGSAFKTVITMCTKNWSNASCASRLQQFVLMAPTVVVLSANDLFSLNPSSHTRGHAHKLYKARCAKGTRQNFFVCRVINVWNSLPNTVCFNSQASFKRSLKNVNFSEFLKCY